MRGRRLREVLDVTAAAEGLPRAGEDDAAHRRVLVHLEHRVEELAGQREAQRVVGVGPVQRDGRDALGHVEGDRLVAHRGLLAGSARNMPGSDPGAHLNAEQASGSGV